jgi:uncharacterized protein (DUF2249 family)
MNTIADSSLPQELDVRPLAPRDKHATIFRLWAALPVGGFFVLINDHDPVPLYYQFAGQYPDAFSWDYLEQGPEIFRVRITRTAVTTAPVPLPPQAHRSPAAQFPNNPVEVDARGLEPPEPLVRILAALADLAPGGTLRARTDRRPLHLFAELDTRGLSHGCDEQSDGSWLTTIRRA